MFNINEIKNKIKENEVYFVVKFEHENKKLLQKIKNVIDEEVNNLSRCAYFLFNKNIDVQKVKDDLNKYFNLKGFKTDLSTHSFSIYWYENEFNIEDYIREIVSEYIDNQN